jgi:predicted HTH transcriptional regulator
MFGYEYEIVREFPGYFLDYQERFDESIRWTHRTISSSGDWSGNLFDFYFRVIYRLSSELNIPFVLNGITRVDNTELHVALREALLNTLVHADYYGRQGTVIIRTPQMITFSNPGDMRISFRAAVGGGVSDPRNSVLMKMFSLIGVGERAGMGIPGLLDIWQRLTGIAPIYAYQFSPNRVTVSMQIKMIGDKSVINGGSGDKSATNSIIGNKSAIKGGGSDKESSSVEQKLCVIIEYMQTHQNVTVADITQLLSIKSSRSRDYLRMLVDRGVVITNGANKNRTYTLNVK